MLIETSVNLKPFNTFGVSVQADTLVHIHSAADIRQLLANPDLGKAKKLLLGGGSNILFTHDVKDVVLKAEIKGMRLVEAREDAWIVEVGAGECWHDVVVWTLANGWPGLENLAMVPGTAGAAPVQNIGAYGVELADRFESLEAVDLVTGHTMVLSKSKCQFDYRHSVFKTAWLADKAMVTQVRLRLPRPWQPVTEYRDIALELERRGNPVNMSPANGKPANVSPANISAKDIFEMVCEIRQKKLPDPAQTGNAGSFFKNPIVTEEQCRDIIGRDPEVVFYELPDGRFKLAAGWLIDACGWKGKSLGEAGVYDKQALILINHGNASGAQIFTLAQAIQESVYGRFGIMLEPEPIIL